MENFELLFPGVARLRLGTPESLTPVQLRQRTPHLAGLAALPSPPSCPLDIARVQGRKSARGFILELPLTAEEELYGLGLQFHSFRQRQAHQAGVKKLLRVNSDPTVDTGDSHAPVPFYVSTLGYGVLVDTARYATFYLGCAHPTGTLYKKENSSTNRSEEARSAAELYSSLEKSDNTHWHVEIEIPVAAGADVYIFWGDELRQAVQRYNLFSGGGCLPPRWGLGVWYRARTDTDQSQALELAHSLRYSRIPCDVLGLEPGWQTQAYPCSYVWSDKFPAPGAMLQQLENENFRVNLWEHVFVHPQAPVAEALAPLSGDRSGFGGFVPDLSLPEARQIFGQQHTQTHLNVGVSGYKLDECDNSDFIHYSWSFPESTQFPSGLDGEQMHSMLGVLYQATIEDAFLEQAKRTYGLVRSSGALAAPYPFVLYSDLYDHQQFIRAIANAGFCGLLWTPEVREAKNPEDLIRRLQSVICSPQALINAWYIKNPPWKQWNVDANNGDDFADNWAEVEAMCRQVLELRMSLVPYLHAAFARYESEGLPPFRALVMDYPEDERVRDISDQYLMGDCLLVAPMIAGQATRHVYLPLGEWYCFWTGQKHRGGQSVEVAFALEQFPLFVRGGSLLPLALSTLHVEDERARELTIRVYGNGSQKFSLPEAEGFETAEVNTSLDLLWDDTQQLGRATRVVKNQNQEAPKYHLKQWEVIG